MLGRTFDGANNSIMLKREYYDSYGCDFQLQYYPFDTQVKDSIPSPAI